MGTAASPAALIDVSHKTRTMETLQSFGSRLPFDFEKSYDFNCQETSTSWLLRLAFSRVPTDGSVNCEVTIRRLDNTLVSVGADLWMKPVLPFPYTDLTTGQLRAEVVFPNHQGRKIIRLLPNEALVRLGDWPLLLEMNFRVLRCHRGSDSADLLGALCQKFFQHLPSLRVEKMDVAYYSPRDAVNVQLPNPCPPKSS